MGSHWADPGQTVGGAVQAQAHPNDLEPWLRLFDTLLTAAAASGNPNVSYDSGHSLALRWPVSQSLNVF